MVDLASGRRFARWIHLGADFDSAKRRVAGWARSNRLDLAIAASLGVVVFAMLLPFLSPHFQGLRGESGLPGDEGTELYVSDAMRRGARLYRDVFDFKGPVGYWLFAVGFSVGGASVKTGRVTIFVVVAAWSALLYLVGRQITDRRWPGLILALFVPFCAFANWPYAYQEYFCQAVLVAAVSAALKATQGRRWLWVVSGALAAIAFWTHIGQGLPAMVALGVGAVALSLASEPRREALRVGSLYLAGCAATSAIVVGWLMAKGVFAAAIDSIFVFPFTHYTTANTTEYGYYRTETVAYWSSHPINSIGADAIATMAFHAPRLAVGAAVIVGLVVLNRLAYRAYAGRPCTSFVLARQDLARLVLPASLGAVALPVVLGKTRSDLVHIGFVAGTSAVVLMALFASLPGVRARSARWLLSSAQLGAALVVGAAVASAIAFHVVNMLAYHPPGDLSAPVTFDSDLIAARTLPTDRVYCLPAGGYRYLYSKRDCALKFPYLELSAYSEGQWPRAADQVVKERPRLLLIGDDSLKKLVSYRPEIKSMYAGASGNFFLDEKRDGPPWQLPAVWTLEVHGEGADVTRLSVRFSPDASDARFLAALPDGDCMGVIDGAIVSIFRGATTYVAQLSADGRRLEGIAAHGSDRHKLTGTLTPPLQ